jgi:hypothetical protein
MSWMRPRGESASCPFSVYVGQAGRHSPQWTHASPWSYVRGSSRKAGVGSPGAVPADGMTGSGAAMVVDFTVGGSRFVVGV